MEDIKGSNNESAFYIALGAVFLLIISPKWLSDGMFLDGTIYAVLSRNLAVGAASFWQPHFSDTLFPVFMEHPPLALGLEGIFFMIFGDSRFVERFYSLLTIFITAIILVSIWKQLMKNTSTGWLPVLFWVLMPTVSWASVNNMLENTLVIFLCLSVLLYIKSLQRNRIVLVCISGLMLSLGFLTKGFVAFAPLAFPFFTWLFLRKNRFSSMVSDSFLMLFSSLLPLVLLFFMPGSGEYLHVYVEMAFSKISEGVTASSRFYILNRLIMEMLPSLGVILVFMFFYRKNKLSFENISSGLRPGAVFFSLGMAGVLPILLTMDQSAYFLLTSLPFFAISIGLFINPLVEMVVTRIDYNSLGYKIFRQAGIVTLSLSIITSVYFSGKINRNRDMLLDMRVITDHLKENSTINILPGMEYDWNLYAYYQRYKEVSLDPDLKNKHKFLLITSSLYSDTIKKGFEKVELKTAEYQLFRRKMADTVE